MYSHPNTFTHIYTFHVVADAMLWGCNCWTCVFCSQSAQSVTQILFLCRIYCATLTHLYLYNFCGAIDNNICTTRRIRCESDCAFYCLLCEVRAGQSHHHNTIFNHSIISIINSTQTTVYTYIYVCLCSCVVPVWCANNKKQQQQQHHHHIQQPTTTIYKQSVDVRITTWDRWLQQQQQQVRYLVGPKTSFLSTISTAFVCAVPTWTSPYHLNLIYIYQQKYCIGVGSLPDKALHQGATSRERLSLHHTQTHPRDSNVGIMFEFGVLEAFIFFCGVCYLFNKNR